MLVRALTQSMDVKTMVKVARRLDRSYDIHARTGTRKSLSVPNKDAARQIVEDMARDGNLLPFVELLVDIHRNGFVGRSYRIPRVQEIINELRTDGYLFDPINARFYEDVQQRKTKNWGVLLEGERYHLGFLAIDVKDNSELVRRYGTETMDGVYVSLRRLIERALDKRNGRLWYWEGDGGLVAFHTGVVARSAVETGMEILHELILYNAMWNPLDDPIQLRLAVNTGQISYHNDPVTVRSAPPVVHAQELESNHTEPNTLSVSATTFPSLDALLQRCFQRNGNAADAQIPLYRPSFEQRRAIDRVAG